MAVVVASSLEEAKHAASLIKITYVVKTPVVSVDDPASVAVTPKKSFGEDVQVQKGKDVDGVLKGADIVSYRWAGNGKTECGINT